MQLYDWFQLAKKFCMVRRATAVAIAEGQQRSMGSPAPPITSQERTSGSEECKSQLSAEEEWSDGSAVDPDSEGLMDQSMSESLLQDAQVNH